jgi:starvation-inducible DNA-binding protein
MYAEPNPFLADALRRQAAVTTLEHAPGRNVIMTTNIGTVEPRPQRIDVDAGVVERLRLDAATVFDLYSQVKQAHWTVVGESFIAVHELFDRQATALRGHIDELAERQRQLGGVPTATVRQAAEISDLPELPCEVLPVAEVVRCVADRYEMLSRQLTVSAREAGDAKDIATEDIYVEILRDLGTQTWFLRSHLE